MTDTPELPKLPQSGYYLWEHPKHPSRVARPEDADFAKGEPLWVRCYPVEVFGGAAPEAPREPMTTDVAKMVEACKRLAHDYADDSHHDRPSKYKASSLCAEAIDALGAVASQAPTLATPAVSRAVSEWISVETRLPDSSRRVIACNPMGYVGAATYANGHWNGIGGASGWMELPKPLATPGESA